MENQCFCSLGQFALLSAFGASNVRSLGRPGRQLGHLGRQLGHLGRYLGANLAILDVNLAILGVNLAVLDANFAVLGINFAILGATLAVLGANLVISGANLAVLGANLVILGGLGVLGPVQSAVPKHETKFLVQFDVLCSSTLCAAPGVQPDHVCDSMCCAFIAG